MIALQDIAPMALGIALLLPWISGMVAVRALIGPGPVTLLLGHGFLLGQLLVILLLLAWNAAGLTLSFVPLASTLAALTGMALVLQLRRITWQGPSVTLGWRDALWAIPLLLFAAERGFSLSAELALRPLFAWDAWMNWVPRAEVWFHQGTLTAFVLPEQWLSAAPDANLYTLGNERANLYPPGIPLLLLWTMLAAGTPDHTLLYVPWILLPAACGIALWGHLRQLALPRPGCALAVYALLSQPLANTHAALPGYADLWLAVAFGMGAMALMQWQITGNRRFGLLALCLALCCALFKVPGLAFAGLLVAGSVVLLWRPPARWLRWSVAAALLLLTTGLVLGLHPDLAQRTAEYLVLTLPGALPTLRVYPAPLLPLLWDSLFVFGNWHLLSLLLLASLTASLLLRGLRSLHNIALLLFVAGFGLLLFVFGLTQYFKEAANGVTLDRTLLYLAPLAVYIAFAQIAQCWRVQAADAER